MGNLVEITKRDRFVFGRIVPHSALRVSASERDPSSTIAGRHGQAEFARNNVDNGRRDENDPNGSRFA